MAAISSIQELRKYLEVSSAGLDLLGVTLAYELASKTVFVPANEETGQEEIEEGTPALVAVAKLRQMLQDCGLELAINNTRTNQAIQRTLSDLVKKDLIHPENQDGHLRTDRRTSNQDRSVFVLAEKIVDPETDEARHPIRTRVIWYKKVGPGEEKLKFIGPLAESVLRPMVETHEKSYTMPQVREQVIIPIIMGIIRAMPLASRGGTYFVLKSRLPQVEKLGKFLDLLGEAAHVPTELIILPTPDNGPARASVGGFAFRALMSDIIDIQKDLAELMGPSRDQDKIRPSTIERYEAKIKDLMDKARMIAGSSTLQLDKLADECAKLQTGFRSLIRQEQPDRTAGEVREERIEQSSGGASPRPQASETPLREEREERSEAAEPKRMRQPERQPVTSVPGDTRDERSI